MATPTVHCRPEDGYGGAGGGRGRGGRAYGGRGYGGRRRQQGAGMEVDGDLPGMAGCVWHGMR